MQYLIHLIPIALFVTIFVGSGIYFSILKTPNAFYQLSAVTAIIPAIAAGWLLHKGTSQQKMHDFLDGIRHKDIITMCVIFLLSGAFSEITQHIGSINAIVNAILLFIPTQYLLISMFLIAALISTCIGTSMGTIATVAPIAAQISTSIGLNPALGMATIVGGAMFGDNLSIISDTTIAAVMSQEADMKQKLQLNAKIALIAATLTMIILLFKANARFAFEPRECSLLLITPYIILLSLAIKGINVFVSLSISITFAGIIGLITQNNYSIIVFSQTLNKGFASMHEIMVLSLMVGGLSGLTGKTVFKAITDNLDKLVVVKYAGIKLAQLMIAFLVSIFDILLANNTIAIIFCGKIAKEIATKHKIPHHYSATWLDIFSCVFQGIIPYGAQILLVSAIAGISPLTIIPYVYYCYLLGIIAILHIIFIKIKR